MFGSNNKLDPSWLASIDFFDGLDDDELRKISALGERLDLDAGAEIIDQGRVGDACYVVVEGRAAVQIGGEFVATVGPGTMVGEMALVDHRPRNASVVAETPMVLVAFGTKEFRKLLDKVPGARSRVIELLEQRLAENAQREQD